MGFGAVAWAGAGAGAGADGAEPVEPGSELGIIVCQAVQGSLELDGAPQPELIEMIRGPGPLQVGQCRRAFPPVIQHVRQVDPSLGKVRVDPERPPQPVKGGPVAAEPVGHIPEAGQRFHTFRFGSLGQIEKPIPGSEQPAPEQCPSRLEHELVILLKAQLEQPLKPLQRALAVSQRQQGFPHAGQRVLVVRIQGERLLEGAPGPPEFLPGQMGVA